MTMSGATIAARNHASIWYVETGTRGENHHGKETGTLDQALKGALPECIRPVECKQCLQ